MRTWGRSDAPHYLIRQGPAQAKCGGRQQLGRGIAAATFLDAGWDFVGETANGPEDIWWILEGKDYPHLWWEAQN
ncbi:MAG: hypothetical protein NTZ17_07960 [Phycisphaerae bacterium]|nr:hypothetical protein [Phycisphaerae bacterium]